MPTMKKIKKPNFRKAKNENCKFIIIRINYNKKNEVQ